MTRPSLEEIRRLAEGARPGPWLYNRERGRVDLGQLASDGTVYDGESIMAVGEDDLGNLALACLDESDARYIAAVDPQTALALLDELEALREATGVLRDLAEDGWLGNTHVDECPEDDTCDCPWPTEVNRVLARLDKLREGR